MRVAHWVRLSLAALLLTALVGAVEAAGRTAETKITVKGLHCPVCAKKVVGKLKEVSGVSDAQADVKAAVLTVTPAKGTTLSPRALWEAVEAAKKVPVRLEGPSGTFTSKPEE